MFWIESMAMSPGIKNPPTLPGRIYAPPYAANASDRHLHGCYCPACELTVSLICSKSYTDLMRGTNILHSSLFSIYEGKTFFAPDANR